MVNYRRVLIKGATYFFTFNLRNRQESLLVSHIQLLRNAFKKTKQNYPFEIIAICVLPDHIHCILRLPSKVCNYPLIIRNIKSIFTQNLIKTTNLYFKNKNKRGSYNIWQSSYWEHCIRNELDLINHQNYIHYNPVKHGLVENVCDWPYSSFHQFVQLGKIEKNWGSNNDKWISQAFGE